SCTVGTCVQTHNRTRNTSSPALPGPVPKPTAGREECQGSELGAARVRPQPDDFHLNSTLATARVKSPLQQNDKLPDSPLLIKTTIIGSVNAVFSKLQATTGQ
ncbi:hypothetical protein C0133_08855, partial [Moraxella catarrhalis]|nr:hypothetical protein [Moraxella catarrhalis]